MRRLIVVGSMLLTMFSLSACSGRETGQQQQDRIERSAGQHILIAYFTWAENTHVENPDEVDVDAATSASVLPPGNAAKLAGWIQEQTGGELFSIVVKEPYSSDYDECLDRAAKEEAEDARPELVNHVENMEKYDVIFLCYPIWWGQAPKIMYTFIENCNLSGKTVIPFCTSASSGVGTSATNLQTADTSQATWLTGRRFSGSSPKSDVENWLAGLGLK